MPDLQNFLVTRIAAQTITNAPRWRIEFQLTNEKTGAVIRDFTGANAFNFPQILGTLSAEQQDKLVTKIVQDIIEARLENA